MIVGASGLHSVCVCFYHQDVKLMLSPVNPALYYKYVLSLCVCDIYNQKCMLYHCDDFPSETYVKHFLKEQLLQHYCADDNIKFKQWGSTDRSQPEDKDEFFDDFCEKLSETLHDLTKHDFISQKQAKFFKEKMESLQPGKCVLLLDFAENYSFVVQDAAQGFYRNNSQATIHLFVLYYVHSAIRKVCHKSCACISNYMVHDTVAVYCFLQKLLNEYVKVDFPHVHKVFCFDDGPGAQYKNFKNFTNLLLHEQDFDLKAE